MNTAMYLIEAHTLIKALIKALITCNKKLADMKIKTHSTCSYCPEDDTIRHFFLFCPRVEAFWQHFFNWWNRLDNIQIPHTTELNILFGYMSNENVFMALNYCILHGKYYIYKQRLFHNNNLDLYEFLVELRYKLQIEYDICKKNSCMDKFDKYVFIFDTLLRFTFTFVLYLLYVWVNKLVYNKKKAHPWF